MRQNILRREIFEGEPINDAPVAGEFPAQMACNAEMFPFGDVIMHLRTESTGSYVEPVLIISMFISIYVHGA